VASGLSQDWHTRPQAQRSGLPGEAHLARGARAALWRLAGPWWPFLLTAIAWLIIAWVALRFTPASIATVASCWACCSCSAGPTNSWSPRFAPAVAGCTCRQRG